MPIKRFPPPGRYPVWDPRGWPEAQLDPPTQPLRLPNQLARLRPAIDPLDVFAALTLPLDVPDPHGLTPLFDRAWALSGMSGRHARTPTGEVPVGKHYDENADGLADHDQPAATAGQEDHTDPWVFAGEDADAPGETV